LTEGKAASSNKSILGKSESKMGSRSVTSLAQSPKQPVENTTYISSHHIRSKQSPACPECTSRKIWKDGLRYTPNGDVQRYLCRGCGYRFSPKDNNALSKPFYMPSGKGSTCQVGATHSPRRVKNLVTVEPLKDGLAGATKTRQEAKGKLAEFTWYMQKQNYSKETIRGYSNALRNLVNMSVDLFNPDNVKEALAKMQVGDSRKHFIAAAYTLFLNINGLAWDPPNYRKSRKLPFIPTERELDDLIMGCGKKTAGFLQTLKETAMRKGEASKLKWADVDLERKTITLNDAEKNGNPRIFEISNKLVSMLASLPRKNEYIFGTPSKVTRGVVFYKERKTLAHRLGNPRLLRIALHTFRHWKATMLYHETKNPILVKEFLGHQNLDATLLYIQLDKSLFRNDSDDFEVKAVKDPEEIKGLIEVGFEYVCEKDGLLFFRKRR